MRVSQQYCCFICHFSSATWIPIKIFNNDGHSNPVIVFQLANGQHKENILNTREQHNGCHYNQSIRPTSKKAPADAEMGPQSQRRISLQQRTHKLAENNNSSNKKQRVQTRVDTGGKAFDPLT